MRRTITNNNSRKSNLIKIILVNIFLIWFISVLSPFGILCGFDASGEACNRMTRFMIYLIAAVVMLIISYKYNHGKYFKFGVLIDFLVIVFVIVFMFGT